MANTALRKARLAANMSQDDLARAIREHGFKRGDTISCTRGTVQRWESGTTKCPQPRYVHALEAVLNRPASSLGFATEQLGVDRSQALSNAGLDSTLTAPDPSANYGPLTGIWLSSYDYFSSSRNATFTSKHYVMVLQRGASLIVRSLPLQSSQVSMELSVNGQVITGSWAEETERGGYYSGAMYYGSIQMLLDVTGRRMAGKWVGFGRDMTVNTDVWSLTLVDSEVNEAAVSRWDRIPD
jgi:transcriptional regulator with XRE-family HTH domain